MRGTVKFFDNLKGWGFITSNEGTDYFVHFSAIKGKGYKYLDADDIVDFEVKECERGWQAVNVQPVLTRIMVEKALKKENLILKPFRNALGLDRYLVVDANNVIQSSEQGMSLIEAAKYAEMDVEGIMNKADEKFVKDFVEQVTEATSTLVTAEIVTDAIGKVMDEKKEDIMMNKNFDEKYALVVKTVTQEAEEDIASKYRKACEHFANMATDDKGFFKKTGISINDTVDLPSVLEAVASQWSTYDPMKKSAVARTIAGEESAHDVMVYLEAMDFMNMKQ